MSSAACSTDFWIWGNPILCSGDNPTMEIIVSFLTNKKAPLWGAGLIKLFFTANQAPLLDEAKKEELGKLCGFHSGVTLLLWLELCQLPL